MLLDPARGDVFWSKQKKLEAKNNAKNYMLENKCFTTCVFRGTLQMGI